MGKNKKKNVKAQQSQAKLEKEPKFIELSSDDEEEEKPAPQVKAPSKKAVKAKAHEEVTSNISKKNNILKDTKEPKKTNEQRVKNPETPKEAKKTEERIGEKSIITDEPKKTEEQIVNKPKITEESKKTEEQNVKSEISDVSNKKNSSSDAKCGGEKIQEDGGEEIKPSDESKAKDDKVKSEDTPSKKSQPNDLYNVKPENEPQGDCIVCGTLAKSFCSNCKHVFYCTKAHQKSHWSNHKDDCKTLKKLPYRIERNHRLGRYLVATRNIDEGEILFNECPLVVGPRQLTKPVCLGCHQELTNSTKIVKCVRCAWPMCSKKCGDNPIHADAECKILSFAETKINVDTFGSINMMYACITVLRALALKNGPQTLWKAYTEFDSHLDKRISTPVYQQVNKEKVVFFIHYYLKLLSKFSDLEILEACGKLDTNCFEIRQNNTRLRAIYRIGSLMSHDCTPNTRHTFDPNNDINVFATVGIKSGEIISATYTQTLWCTLNRREHLHMSKCFWCECRRCQDPTEFGTYLSAFSCSNCGARMLSSNPLDQGSLWKCEKCKFTIEGSKVKEGIDRVMEDLKSTDRGNVDNLEDFIKKYSTILPDTHQIVREIHYGIVSLLRINHNDKEIQTNQLLKKALLCKQLLSVADKIERGFTQWRGELLFEMQSANVILVQRALADGRISKTQAQNVFEDNLKYLKEAIQILKIQTESKEKLQKEMENLAKAMAALDV